MRKTANQVGAVLVKTGFPTFRPTLFTMSGFQFPAGSVRLLRRLLRRLLGGTVLLACAAPAWALESISLQLKWRHAFQFAGYYAAQEKGFYREAGLDVNLRAAGPGIDPLEAVLSGKAQYGVGTSSLLLARKAGKPVVVLAVVFQHSPLVLVARHDPAAKGTQGIHDIVGKRVMIEPQSDELIAYLKQEGIARDRLQLVPHSFDTKDLIEGRVDAISAYVTNEPYALDRAGLAYQTYTPRMGGIDFYGDNLFTTEQELKTHPERVRAFRQASLRGWQYAMEHPEEIAELILAKYARHYPREFLLYEARRMVPLLRTDLIEVGYMTRGRWRHIAETYAVLGLLPGDYSLDGFLYEPDVPPNLTRFYIALGLLAAMSALAAYIFRINRRLTNALAEKTRAEAQIRELAFFDPLTHLPNRRLLQDRFDRMLAMVRRDGGHGALLFLDLDNFKPLNDCHGHDTGDQLLVAVAGRLTDCVRDTDTVARFGGDEFVILIGELGHDAHQACEQAGRLATKLLEQLAAPHLLACTKAGNSEKVEHCCTASIGVALFDGHADGEDILRRADTAMYRAKEDGRNRIFIDGGESVPPAEAHAQRRLPAAGLTAVSP